MEPNGGETSQNAPRITMLLRQWSSGDTSAAQELFPHVYAELSRQARLYLHRERTDHTLETAALIHEVYVRLTESPPSEWENRVHFFALAASAMRRVLVDHARRTRSQKRGGGYRAITLSGVSGELRESGGEIDDVIVVDRALRRLAEIDEQRARLVELRFFAGLSHEEIAPLLGVSLSTVERHWRLARAWLRRELSS